MANNISKANLGVDVIITIFCDFGQFSAKKWLLKNVMIKFLHNLASF
jgi:hypothetical protein